MIHHSSLDLIGHDSFFQFFCFFVEKKAAEGLGRARKTGLCPFRAIVALMKACRFEGIPMRKMEYNPDDDVFLGREPTPNNKDLRYSTTALCRLQFRRQELVHRGEQEAVSDVSKRRCSVQLVRRPWGVAQKPGSQLGLC